MGSGPPTSARCLLVGTCPPSTFQTGEGTRGVRAGSPSAVSRRAPVPKSQPPGTGTLRQASSWRGLNREHHAPRHHTGLAAPPSTAPSEALRALESHREWSRVALAWVLTISLPPCPSAVPHALSPAPGSGPICGHGPYLELLGGEEPGPFFAHVLATWPPTTAVPWMRLVFHLLRVEAGAGHPRRAQPGWAVTALLPCSTALSPSSRTGCPLGQLQLQMVTCSL